MFTCEFLKSRRLGAGSGGILLACLLGCLPWGRADDRPRGPVVVKIQDDKPTVIESGSTGPLDPVQRIRIMPQMPQQPLNINISGEQGQTLQLSHFPAFNIDGQFVSPLNALGGGRIEMLNGKLPKTPTGKDRVGYMTVYVRGDLRLTLTVEATPTKPPGPGQKRQLDAVLIRYVMENKGTQNHKLGLRVYMDTYIVDNDGVHPVTPIAGERNGMHYIPLGVGVIIPPWNFAFAIMVGMTAASIVTGNTVVLKPSSDSPVIAAKFVELLESVGMPSGVVNLITGSGGAIGDELVKHPRVRYVAFTGSKEIGLRVNQLAAQPQPGQIWIKRVVAEMGGKDSIVVAADADLDAAVEGVAQAAYGYQGQKCSACSRAIVEAPIYDEFIARLNERVKKISVGDPSDPANYMGPVINERSLEKIESYVEAGKREGRLVSGGGRVGSEGWFAEPTVFADIPPDGKLAQEEIFGPVLAVIKAKDFDNALEIANNTEFGLTGAVYSSDPAKLAHARDEFHVGNLYLNRKCTGAMVGAHPFGGFNMSGTDSKAGGPDYLLLFMQAKSVSEKIG